MLGHARRLALCLAVALVGCGGDDDDPAGGAQPDAGSRHVASGIAMLTDRARVLDEVALAALKRVRQRDEQVELVFSEARGTLEGVETGEVLILGPTELTPDGALLEVETVTEEDAQVSLLTKPAPLRAAFERLKVALEATLDEPSSTTLAEEDKRAVAVTRQALGLSFPIALGIGDGSNRIALSGALSLDSSIDLTLDFDITELALDELTLRFSGEETFAAELIAEGSTTIDETIPLGSVSFAPITLLLPIPAPPGFVPVVLTPRVALAAGVTGNVTGEVQASVLQEASFSAGLGYQDGEFGGISDSDSTFEFEQPTFEAGASLRAWAGPRMEVLL